ncbi:MAG TPA: hypothetical protein VFR81_13025 [Longimicrobium sp.]|nr:hypothetical protein [Longimicrobium sp.]
MRAPFRHSILRTAVLLASAWSASAAAQAPASTPAPAARACDPAELRALATRPRASMFDGRVSLVPPAGLPAFNPPAATGEELVFLGPSGTSVILSMGDLAEPGELDRFKDELTRSVPGLKWISRGEMVELGGVRWERVEYTGDIVGIQQHSEVYIAPFQGRSLTLSVTYAPASQRARWKAALDRSVATLRVRDCALPGESAPSPAGR